MAVTDGEVAQTTGTDDTGHCSQVQQADRRDGCAARDGGYAFLQVYAEDDLQRCGAHRERRFDQTAVQLGKCTLHLTGEERHRTEYQRYDSAADIDGRTHNRTGNRHYPRQQDDERDGTEQADQLVQNLIDDFVFQNAARLGDGDEHAQRQPEHERDCTRPDHHEQRVTDGCVEVRQLCHYVWNDVIQKLLHP